MVGDKLTRAHICKIQVFAKKNKDCASKICKNYEPQICKISKTQICRFFKFLPNFMVGVKLTKAHICKILVFAKKNEGLCWSNLQKF